MLFRSGRRSTSPAATASPGRSRFATASPTSRRRAAASRFWLPTYVDVRDEKVALVASYLPAGTYEYTFQVQATVPGEYRVLPVHGEMLYFPEVWGRSTGALFTVTE